MFQLKGASYNDWRCEVMVAVFDILKCWPEEEWTNTPPKEVYCHLHVIHMIRSLQPVEPSPLAWGDWDHNLEVHLKSALRFAEGPLQKDAKRLAEGGVMLIRTWWDFTWDYGAKRLERQLQDDYMCTFCDVHFLVSAVSLVLRDFTDLAPTKH